MLAVIKLDHEDNMCFFLLYYCSAFNVHHSEICNLNPIQKAAERGGYGTERYEQLEFQKKVAEHYRTLYDASWKVAFISEVSVLNVVI